MVRPTQIIKKWADKPRLAAIETMNAYGEPDEGSKNQLLWNYRGPWARIAVENDEVVHTYPSLHTECCTYTIEHAVPFTKAQQLVNLNSSLLVDYTKGTVSVRAENERIALLEFNMAQQLLEGRNEHDVRETLAREALKLHNGEPSLFATKLLFSPQRPLLTDHFPDLSAVRLETDSIKYEVEEIGERIKRLGERIKDSAQT